MPFKIQAYILLFFAMSVFGWIMEVICKYIEFRRWINRGFLIGPYCPIYGVGSVLIVLILERYASSPVIVFFLTMIICGTLEYLTSYVMEKLFRARWWDYSHKLLNLDGRVYAGTLIPFGLLGLGLLYVIKPALFRLFASVPSGVLTTICILLCVLLAADVAVSTRILGKVRSTANLTGADDTEALTKAVREKLFGKSILFRRTLRAFPYARIYNKRLLQQLKKHRSEMLRQSKLRRYQLRDEFCKWDQKKRAETVERKRARQKKDEWVR